VCSVKHQKQLSGGQGPRPEKQCKDRIAEKPGKYRAFWNAYLMQAVSEINKDMNMMKYARIVEEKVDNIHETANPITDSFR
jgi:hypothetical protein